MATAPSADVLTAQLQDIRTLIGHKRLQDAAKALNAIQKTAPGDPRIPLLGMRLAEEAGNIQDATRAARRALQLAPQWPVAQVELARVLTRQRQHDEAMQLAVNALAGAPEDPRVMVSAINVAMLAGNQEQTLKWAEEGIRRFPDNAGIRLFLARYLLSLGRAEEAREHYAWAWERASDHTESLYGLLTCALRMQDMPAAQGHADRLLELAPEDPGTLYWHAIAHGKTPATQPREIITQLFDPMAAGWDMHVVGTLKYHLPQRISDLLLERWPDKAFNLLDLGCGTGLVAIYLGPLKGHIVGVDLSPGMLGQANRHGLYSRLHQVNILDALRDTPADLYEAICCADALPYVGDLSTVIPNALRILKAGGIFVFSCEAAPEDGPDLVLQPTGRYAHKLSAVREQCLKAGFGTIRVEKLSELRLEGGEPIDGFLVVASKRKTTAATLQEDPGKAD